MTRRFNNTLPNARDAVLYIQVRSTAGPRREQKRRLNPADRRKVRNYTPNGYCGNANVQSARSRMRL